MGHRTATGEGSVIRLNGEQPPSSHKSCQTPDAWTWRRVIGLDACSVPYCKFSVPHDFPAQKFLLEGVRCDALHCLAAWPNESAGRYQIVHRNNRCPGPAVCFAL